MTVKYFMILALYMSLFVSLVAQEPYGAKNDPFRVAMRDMKKEFKVLESFEADKSISEKAMKSCKKLVKLFEKAQKMKPAFLNADQHKSYDKHYTDMISAVQQHLAYLKKGDVEKAQDIYSVLSDLKKKAHDQFSKQAKKFHGAE